MKAIQNFFYIRNAQNIATPPLTHSSESAKLTCAFVSETNDLRKIVFLSLGSSIHMTKLVEWPVVDNCPRKHAKSQITYKREVRKSIQDLDQAFKMLELEQSQVTVGDVNEWANQFTDRKLLTS